MSLRENPDYRSGAAHVALLAAMPSRFPGRPPFEEVQETIPVELMTTSDVNEIVQAATSRRKRCKPNSTPTRLPMPRQLKPQAAGRRGQEGRADAAAALKRDPDPGDDDKPEPPKPPAKQPRAAAAARADAAPADPPTSRRRNADEAITRRSRSRRRPSRPPKEGRNQARPQLKLGPDRQIARDGQAARTCRSPSSATPARPKSGEETHDQHKFDPPTSASCLSHAPPARSASTGRDDFAAASLGSPTANAQRMSPSLQAAMEGWFQDHFRGCWTTADFTLPQGPKYVPDIRVPLNLDGSLAADPTLINPPDDPAWQPLADSAMRAVRKCDPLPVPDRFKPYYDEWRDRSSGFEAPTQCTPRPLPRRPLPLRAPQFSSIVRRQPADPSMPLTLTRRTASGLLARGRVRPPASTAPRSRRTNISTSSRAAISSRSMSR